MIGKTKYQIVNKMISLFALTTLEIISVAIKNSASHFQKKKKQEQVKKKKKAVIHSSKNLSMFLTGSI